MSIAHPKAFPIHWPFYCLRKLFSTPDFFSLPKTQKGLHSIVHLFDESIELFNRFLGNTLSDKPQRITANPAYSGVCYSGNLFAGWKRPKSTLDFRPS
jgi:hypothetical protein